MVNTKKEFLSHLKKIQKKGKEITSAIIVLRGFMIADLKIVLNPNYSEREYDNFLKVLNVKYDNGYGGQELYGYIWYNDGTWSERSEYDGSEWWSYKKCPSFQDKIIINLKRED